MSSRPPIPAGKLRIGFDAKRAFNNGTGLGNYSRFVIRTLVRYFPEHEYFLFTPAVRPEFEGWLEEAPNIHLVTPETFLQRTFSSAWRSYSVTDLVQQFQLDVFHGLSNELPRGIEKLGLRKIVTIHDLIFLRYPGYYSNIDRYIYTRKFRHACEHADLILAASEQTRQDIMGFFHTDAMKIGVAYQDCDTRFSQTFPAEELQRIALKYGLSGRFLLCIGTIEQRKDQLTVLKAFQLLGDASLKLVFIGRQTDYARSLHEFITGHELQQQVIFLQQVPQEELALIAQQATLFVYASAFEGFGIPVLEGLRSRVPVIASRTSSLPEVGGDAAAYFKFGDAAELSVQMRVILGDQERRDEMIRKGLLQAQKFDAEQLAAQLVQWYRM